MSTATMECSVGGQLSSCNVAIDYLRGTAFISDNIRTLIFLQFPTPIHGIHVTFHPNPDCDLVVSSEVVKFGIGCFRGKTVQATQMVWQKLLCYFLMNILECKDASELVHLLPNVAAIALLLRSSMTSLIWIGRTNSFELDCVMGFPFGRLTSYQHQKLYHNFWWHEWRVTVNTGHSLPRITFSWCHTLW